MFNFIMGLIVFYTNKTCNLAPDQTIIFSDARHCKVILRKTEKRVTHEFSTSQRDCDWHFIADDFFSDNFI